MQSRCLKTQVGIRDAWNAKRPNKKLDRFVDILLGRPEWETFAYVGAYSTIDTKAGTEDFVKLVQSKDFSGPHYSPYFVLHSDGELMLARMMVRDLSVWDFHTGKRLKKP